MSSYSIIHVANIHWYVQRRQVRLTTPGDATSVYDPSAIQASFRRPIVRPFNERTLFMKLPHAAVYPSYTMRMNITVTLEWMEIMDS